MSGTNGSAPSEVAADLSSGLQRQTGAGSVSIAAGARSVTVLVYAGAPTVTVGGGRAVPVEAGTTLTWSVDHGGPAGEQLLDAFTITGADGDDVLVATTRKA